MPDWLRTLQLSPGPAAGGARKPSPRLGAVGGGSPRRLWWTSAALLLTGGLVMAFLGFGERTADPDRLGDRSFARAADERCQATGKALGSEAGRALEGPAEVERIAGITAAWEATAVDLRALPVAPEDARRVEVWLTTWDRWVGLGYDYAEALRTGSSVEAEAILDEAEAPKESLRRFAVVNEMDDCAFG